MIKFAHRRGSFHIPAYRNRYRVPLLRRPFSIPFQERYGGEKFSGSHARFGLHMPGEWNGPYVTPAHFEDRYHKLNTDNSVIFTHIGYLKDGQKKLEDHLEKSDNKMDRLFAKANHDLLVMFETADTKVQQRLTEVRTHFTEIFGKVDNTLSKMDEKWERTDSKFDHKFSKSDEKFDRLGSKIDNLLCIVLGGFALKGGFDWAKNSGNGAEKNYSMDYVLATA